MSNGEQIHLDPKTRAVIERLIVPLRGSRYGLTSFTATALYYFTYFFRAIVTV